MLPYSKRLTEPELNALVLKLIDGDKLAEEAIIMSYTALVRSFALKLTGSKDTDELIGIGLLQLTRAVQKIPYLDDPMTYGAYVYKSVYFEMFHKCAYDGLVKVPKQAYEKWGHLANPRSLVDRDTSCDKVVNSLEVREILELVLTRKHEREVFDMVRAGYKTKEIAAELKVSAPRVSQIRHDVFNRLKKEFRD